MGMSEYPDMAADGGRTTSVAREASAWRSPRTWLILVAVCTCVGLLEGTQAWLGSVGSGRFPELTWWEGIASTLPSWYVLGALIPLIFAIARRFPLDDGRWKRSLPVHLCAAAAFAVVHLGVSNAVSEFLIYRGLPSLTFGANMSRLLGVYFIIEVFFYAMFVGAAYAIAYRRVYRERERVAAELALKTSRLEGSLVRANLESLRMQLNPHFLFNTLNAISVMALKGERQGVVRTLNLLSELLRVSLDNTAQVVSLRDEVAFLQRYLDIEEIRFGDRLSVVLRIPAETLDAEVPSLILQPLVENAIRHGVSRKAGRGTIQVAAMIDAGMLVLEVADNGPGFGTTNAHTRTGIGLANTRARLEQLYGSAQTMQLEEAPGGGALVRLRLPLRNAERDRVTTTAAAEARTA
jgi:sensor histidine kinase YesM